MRGHLKPGLFVFVFLCLLVGAAFALQLISKEQEIEIGRQSRADLEKKYGVVDDPGRTSMLDFWGKRIAAKSDRPDLPYEFKILNMKEVNALSLPGGFVYVTKGLVDLDPSAKEIECVLGHEIAHAARRHIASSLERSMGIDMLLKLLTGGKSSQAITYQVLQVVLDRGYSREDEFEADRYGSRYAFDAGYDPQGMIDFLQRLLTMSGGEKQDILGPVLATHPATKDRIERLKPWVAQLNANAASRPAGPNPDSLPSPMPTSLPSPCPTCIPSPTPSPVPLSVTITSPLPDQQVSDHLVITGRTNPLAKVTLEVVHNSGGFLQLLSQQRSVQVQANDRGEFRDEFDASPPFNGGTYLISAVAEDGSGKKSEKASLTVKRR